MSEASRALALAHAVAVHQGTNDTASVLETAEAFHAFITGTENVAKEAPAKPAKAAAPVKPAATKPKKAAPPPVEDAEEEEEEAPTPDDDGAPTKEEVGEAIEALLNANLRAKVIKLFEKYNAKSLSSLKPEDYAAIKSDAEDLLLNA